MMLRKLLLCLLAAVVFQAPAQTPNPPSNAAASTKPISLSLTGLHVQGNRILNGLNQAVALRGVDKSGTEYFCLGSGNTAVFDGPANSTDVANLAAWGVNIVRLPINEQCWLGVNGLPIANYTAAQYQTAIINYVNLLTAANIAAIIDLQWAAPGIHQSTPSPQALIPMPDADHAPAFWTSVANTFKTNSLVIFDLFNEPFPDNNSDTVAAWSCLRDGCTSIYPNDNSNYTSVGMQSLVNTIRATGATNIIMSPGVEFTNVLTQWITYKPTDSTGNLVAEWHSYAGQTCSSISCFDANVAPVLANAPLITGEMGESDCQHIYVDPLMIWLDAHYGNYLAWAWNTYDCSGFPAVISSYDGTPTSFGIGVRNHFLSMAGATPPAPPVIPFFNNGVFPYGIAVGSSTNYVASDGTTYFADVAATGLSQSVQFFTPYTNSNSITNTSDPTLYQKGRYGQFGTWTINVPNATYNVTLGFAPATAFTQTTVNQPSTASINNMGEFGQDQTVQGNKLGTCVGSQFFNGNNSPYSTPATSCPVNGGGPVPTVNAAFTVVYTGVSVFNQQLTIQPASSFGGGRQTILNSIRVDQQSLPSIPLTPTNLTATGGNVQVSLSWTASNGATSYNIYRAINPRGFYRQIAAPTTNSYTDILVVNNKTYYYIISAANVAGASPRTSFVSATPSLPPPSTPVGVNASAGNTQITISWTASSGATSYHVKRSTVNGGPYTQVAAPASSPYTDTGLTNNTVYYYVVSALNSAGESANSLQVNATPVASGQTGVWVNVTPSAINASNNPTQTVGADPTHPGTLYTTFDSAGIWKSVDYGQSWVGPINTGVNGANITSDGGSGMTVGADGSLYFSCIRGNLIGFFKSTNGGVDWTYYNTPLSTGTLGTHGTEQDLYYPRVDPHNVNHLLMTAHEQPFLFQSNDGGQTWANIPLPSGMTAAAGGTAFSYFIDTGNAATTANTWLWIMQGTGGTIGTWRTTNGGTSWTQVNSAEHNHGTSQMYQPNTTGDLFLPEVYGTAAGFSADNAWGVLHSSDYGQTWALVGIEGAQNVCIGTSKNIYCNNGAALNVGSNYEVSPTPGTGNTWTQPASPASWTWGTGQFVVVNDGTHNIIISADWVAGLWRYIEP